MIEMSGHEEIQETRKDLIQSSIVSILMPAYNGEKYIKQAIDSVLAQTYPYWELIIIDDGSTDNTAQIVNSIKDPRIYYVYQENRGQAAALNTGIDIAQGYYLTTLDVDDWLTQNSLHDRVRFLEEHPEYSVVYGDGYYCDVEGTSIMRFSEYREGNFSGDIYHSLIATPIFSTGGNVLIVRQVLDQFDIRYDEAIIWCQDWDFYIRIAEHVSFGYLEKPTIWYRIHAFNMTISLSRKRKLASLIQMKNKVMTSNRFQCLPSNSKEKFFLQFLLIDLGGQMEDQARIFSDPTFRSMNINQKGRIMRLVAGEYLSNQIGADFAKSLLFEARRLNPLDIKTHILAVLINMSPAIVVMLKNTWQKLRNQSQ
jgi:glycosyltransferase involved in cell wall biosynthesis